VVVVEVHQQAEEMVVVGMSFRQGTQALNKMVVMSFFLLVVSRSALAGERTSEKPVDWEGRLERLRATPYVSLSADIVAESDTGVVFYDPERAYDGYNLYNTKWSGEAFLMDMAGRVAHGWSYLPIGGRGAYHYVVMLENGDLAIIKKDRKLLRVNWNSEPVWEWNLKAHHDIAPAPDGSFYTLIEEFKYHRGLRVMFDTIVHLTAEGEEIDRWSTYDHLAEIKSVLDTRSFLDTVLDGILYGRSSGGEGWEEFKRAIVFHRYNYEYFHINAISVFPANLLGKKDSRFQKGNLLICSRLVNQIVVLEKDTYRVLWAWGEGQLEKPHHPTMLENGNILIFDNGAERKYSRVVELDPASATIVWEYKAEPAEDFYSFSRGSAQRLPNGNTLICESDKGHVFEVTEGGEVVWAWLNPAIRGEHRETLYRMTRLPSAHVEGLLGR
jgi:hypothetical protein